MDKRDVQCQRIRIGNAPRLLQIDCSQSQLKEMIEYFGPFFNNVHFRAPSSSIPNDELTALLSALSEIPFYDIRIIDEIRFELYEPFLRRQFEMDSLKEADFSFKKLSNEFKKDLEKFLTTKAYKRVELSSVEFEFGLGFRFYEKLLDSPCDHEKIIFGFYSYCYELLRDLKKCFQVCSSKRKIVWKREDDVEITAHFTDDQCLEQLSFRCLC